MSTQSYFKDLQQLKYRDEINLVSDLIDHNDWINEFELSLNGDYILIYCRKY